MKHATKLKLAIILTNLSLTLGCAHSGAKYEPIVDGEMGDQYTSDLGACQSLATERRFANGDVKSEAIAGAVTGAVLGAIDDGLEGAVGAAIAGSVLSSGARAWETRDERKQIVVECMRQRGHQVVG